MNRRTIPDKGIPLYAGLCLIMLIIGICMAGCTGQGPKGSAGEAGAVGSGVGVAKAGDLVEVEYTGTLSNGSVFDTSKGRGPFSYVIGSGNAIKGFDKNIMGMKLGETKKFTAAPEEAYGVYNASYIKVAPRSFIPAQENVTRGDRVTLFDGANYFQVTVKDMDAKNVTFDLNHPLAGQALTFEVTLTNLTAGPK